MIVRPVSESDVADLARVHRAAWLESYGQFVDQAYRAAQTPEVFAANWQKWQKDETVNILAAENEGGEITGLASFGKLKTPPPGSSPIRPLYAAEIYALFVLPSYWGKGVAQELLAGAAAGLQAQQLKSLCLWVIENNDRALSFYKKAGGARCGRQDIEIGHSRLREICFGWRDSNVLLTG